MIGAVATVKIDGTDLKDYGMVVNEVPNGMAAARDVTEIVPLRHGSIDNTSIYESKQFTMTGQIVGDTASGLQSNIDGIKQIIRLRSDATLFEIEFQNRTGYVWKCRYVAFDVRHPAGWYAGTTAEFTLVVKAITPFAQKTTASTASGYSNVGKIETISYAGNAPTPLDIDIKGRDVTNKLYNVSDATTGWSVSNCAIATDAGSAQFPAMYQSYNLKITKSGAGAFFAYRDILSLLVSGYYCISVYIRVYGGSSSNVRLRLVSDVATIDGNYITSYLYMGRSFLKIDASALSGAAYAYFQVESDDGNTDVLFDGCTCNQITTAEYNDSGFVPYPYTDHTSEIARHFFYPYADITGKNLCPCGTKDLDVDNWVAGGPKRIWDVERDRMVIVTVGSATNTRLRSRMFRLDEGTYTMSFRYKAVTSGTILMQLMAVGETTAGKINLGTWDESYYDGLIFSEALSVASTAWQTKSKTFTVGKGVPWVALSFYDNGGTDWEEFRLCEIQIETGSSQTSFEYYRKKSLSWNGTIEDDEKLIIGAANGSALHINQATGEVDNAMSGFTGEFFEVLPGTNHVIFWDQRSNVSNPETIASGRMAYDIARRDRVL